jgi:hypothetical protein
MSSQMADGQALSDLWARSRHINGREFDERNMMTDDLPTGLSRRAFVFGGLGLAPSGLFDFFNWPSIADISGTARIGESVELLKQDAAMSGGHGFDATLEEDARSAWKYFEIWKSSAKAIIPGTAYLNDNKVAGYPLVTMWDVGSLVLAFCSAFLLGLITQVELNVKAIQIVKLLKAQTISFKGGNLPRVEVSATNSPSKRSGFDSADVGRLLVALKILDHLTLGKFPIASLVAGWNFHTVISHGNVCGLANGRLSTCFDTSYSHYAKRGYELWGHKLEPVSGFADGPLDSQGQLSLLREIIRRGRIATEPNATEAVELGENPSLALALDLLFAAQIKRFKNEGKLTCVSEGIVDQSPWFTYQACQFGEDGKDNWVIDTTDSTTREIALKLGNSLRTISPKGCFLWNAIRPGAYSTRLVELARRRARTKDIGFSSNLYESDLRPTFCSDINANAMILESVAYVKHGRRPLLQIALEHRETHFEVNERR